MFFIFYKLMRCKIINVCDSIKENLMKDFSEILDIYFEISKFSDSMESFNEEEIECIKTLDSKLDPDFDYIEFLKKAIKKLAISKSFRKKLLKHLDVLDYFDDEFRSTIINNLFENFDLDWRYRKELIKYCSANLKKIGFEDSSWLNVFLTDNVYHVRAFAKLTKENIYGSRKDL